MIAAKNGVVEMVEKILELFPSRIKDVNDEGKNALHLAAGFGMEPDCLNTGEALSIIREIKWFEFVKKSMLHCLLKRYNRRMETPEDIFKESHKKLMESEGEWATKTSQACSVVSTLVASVAYATCTNVPGGYDDKGYAIHRNKPTIFKYFVGYSLTALFCSLISTICFLSIVASPSQFVHSWRYIPVKLYFGIYFMFFSIVCLWISFCAGHFFIIDDDSQKSDNPLLPYIVFSSGIILLVVAQLPTFVGPIFSNSLEMSTPRRKPTRPIDYRRTKNKGNSIDLNHQN